MWKKYKALILYVFFGICTTIVNLICYAVCTRLLDFSTVKGTAFAWILAVIFAYLSNRTWVFQSDASGIREMAKECGSFFLCRFLTGIFDIFFMTVSVDWLGFPDFIMKLLSNIAVILLNYIASKVIIFKKKPR